ncbi:4Fe-4S binding protein [Geomonas propionica]|uniref:4Fe-4S binding protein n=1 Tax=Geomonas propionica TaxID=2798582 RepID=A0ABS0YLE2_9BACT|nr:4Fe-4S binding protein [Geomonas propionica]MBJ6798795.1 4Fe-4S binding protein [Geomonas propionica]
MGHGANAKEAVYTLLAERLKNAPVGTPINDELMDILHHLYTESEAMVGGKFPMAPMKLEQIVSSTGIGQDELEKTLQSMIHKGLVLNIPTPDGTVYMLSPMMIGFFEFTFNRVKKPDYVELKQLAEQFDKYLNNPEVRNALFGGDTTQFRTLVYENVIPHAVQTQVMTYEKASEVIRQAGYGAIALCTCRHKASHLGKECEINAPMDVCTTLGNVARMSVAKGWAREATVDELLEVLDRTHKLGLVHLCDNVLNEPAFICHCCSCCCEVLGSIKEYGISAAHPSNFLPALDAGSCDKCGICAKKCPIDAIKMANVGDGVKMPEVNNEICIGCGVCASACPKGSLTMTQRTAFYVPPENKMEQLKRIAGEKGKAVVTSGK